MHSLNSISSLLWSFRFLWIDYLYPFLYKLLIQMELKLHNFIMVVVLGNYFLRVERIVTFWTGARSATYSI